MIARHAGLEVDPKKFGDTLEVMPLYLVKPDIRADPKLALQVNQRIAPLEIRSWMRSVSILPWLDEITTRNGAVDREKVYGNLAMDLMATGMVLETMLDEIHFQANVFTATVERLTRRLFVLETLVGMERKDRSSYV